MPKCPHCAAERPAAAEDEACPACGAQPGAAAGPEEAPTERPEARAAPAPQPRPEQAPERPEELPERPERASERPEEAPTERPDRPRPPSSASAPAARPASSAPPARPASSAPPARPASSAPPARPGSVPPPRPGSAKASKPPPLRPRSGVPASSESSWQSRLDAARREVSGVPKEAPLPSEPPPLKRSFTKKPAHLALSQLDAIEIQRKTEPNTDDLMQTAQAQQEIADVSLDLPTSPPSRRKIPDWAVVLVLALCVIGGVVYFAQRAGEAPKPVAKIDPKLQEQLRIRKKAMAALESGHELSAAGQHPKAIVAYREALKLDPKLSQAERGLAIAYSGLHKAGVAVRHYQRYLEMEPGADDAAEVRKIIKDYEKRRRR